MRCAELAVATWTNPAHRIFQAIWMMDLLNWLTPRAQAGSGGCSGFSDADLSKLTILSSICSQRSARQLWPNVLVTTVSPGRARAGASQIVFADITNSEPAIGRPHHTTNWQVYHLKDRPSRPWPDDHHFRTKR